MFAAYTDGVYKYCFSNRVSTLEQKYLKFNMEIGESPKDQVKKSDSKLIDLLTHCYLKLSQAFTF